MTEQVVKTHADFLLPPTVVSRVDVSRLVEELEYVDNELTSAAVHAKIGDTQRMEPTVSEQLANFLELNELSLSDSHQRSVLVAELRRLKDTVPIVHMTFAVEADRESLGQLVQWLRASVHPQAVIAVGLQPALIAGVYLRTSNQIHDLSLRTKLKGSRSVLMKELEAVRGSN
jgi:hypothetical protein